MAGTVAITFQVECAATKCGDAVFITGTGPELGDWNPAKAVPCVTTPQLFPRWTSETVMVAAKGGKLEFKILVQAASRGSPDKARWEPGSNHAIVLPESSGQVQIGVTCTWGEPEVTFKSKTTGGAAPAPASAKAPLAERLETNVHFAPVADDDGEAPQPFAPKTTQAPISSGGGADGMARTRSRHLCMTNDGMLNQEMSRTPSLMLVDFAELEEQSNERSKLVEELERTRLNQLQRRMQSGTLLEEMKKITDFANPSKTIMLQGFNWESWRAGGGDWYGVISSKVDMLAEFGFTDVWLPPCSASVAPQGYLPSQLFSLDGSKYGNQASLEALLKKMHDVGMRGLADIVVNHRCGDKQDNQGRWNQFTSGGIAEKRPSFAGVMDWGGWAITLGDKFSDGSGQHAPGHCDTRFDAAPDIDHRNAKVQESISVWLRWLRLQVGFDGWRFDFVKGYGGEFVGHYCKKSGPAWAVGELWGDMAYDGNGLCHNQDQHRQDLCNWVNATEKQCTAFDFTTKGVLQEAIKNTQYWRLRDSAGKPPGMIGWWPEYAVTFLDNHDTGSTQRHWPFPDDKVLVGYAYLLTHPGIPCVFWDHFMDWGEDHRRRIGDLIKARRDSDIPVDAPVNILTAENDLYLAEIGSPPALRVALGPRGCGDPDMNYWSSGPGGNQYRVWIRKMAEEKKPTPPVVAPAAPVPAPASAPAPAPAKAATVAEVKAPEAPKAEPAKAEPAKAEPAKAEPKAGADKKGKKDKKAEENGASFPAIVVGGETVNPQKLSSMSQAELQKLVGSLEAVVKAANEAMKGKS